MTARSPGVEVPPTPRPASRVHVLGAGPVGLFVAALLQSIDGQQVSIYERPDAESRTRMVSLAEYLIADSIESYKAVLKEFPKSRYLPDIAEGLVNAYGAKADLEGNRRRRIDIR